MINKYIGNFHKTLEHNKDGEVDDSRINPSKYDPNKYEEFEKRCKDFEKLIHDCVQRFTDTDDCVQRCKNTSINTENEEDCVQRCKDLKNLDFSNPPIGNFNAARFTNPQAGAATDTLGLNPKCFNMSDPPNINSDIVAAEMVELYWMALLRDKPLNGFEQDSDVLVAVNEIQGQYVAAVKKVKAKATYTKDLPKLPFTAKTLFGCGLQGEDIGPRISQFFLQDIPYGVQTISPRQTPYIMGLDFLTNFNDWLIAQNTGLDKFGRDYGTCNNYGDQANGKIIYYANTKRYISTMRDMARFVNRDALHQSYFNAALFLDALGAETDAGNPYKNNGKLVREDGFATLGGPDLLTLVSEVASRALKVVWRQKWFIHRRARPEAYGGLLEVERIKNKNYYSISNLAKNSEAAKRIFAKHETYLLPMAFSAGSPNHPAYGAGHATVAGACVTILKAWFDEKQSLAELIYKANNKPNKDGHIFPGLLQPGKHLVNEDFEDPQRYFEEKEGEITIEGELNKLASNVAMGRSMGGVHWRSDNTRSLRLGEEIAIKLLQIRKDEYAEKNVSFSFTSFDGKHITIK